MDKVLIFTQKPAVMVLQQGNEDRQTGGEKLTSYMQSRELKGNTMNRERGELDYANGKDLIMSPFS